MTDKEIITTPKFTPIDDNDDELCLMTVKEFDNACKGGSFNDDDGYGEWSTATETSDQVVSPSTRHEVPEWATHVNWYNK